MISVIMSWEILPASVANMLLMRIPGSRKTTLPRYSPTRFGVHRLIAFPESIAKNALGKDIREKRFKRNCHFNVSMAQLRIAIERQPINIQTDNEFESIEAVKAYISLNLEFSMT